MSELSYNGWRSVVGTHGSQQAGGGDFHCQIHIRGGGSWMSEAVMEFEYMLMVQGLNPNNGYMLFMPKSTLHTTKYYS